MMSPQHASDEVTDLIASIEMHRQEIERESGLEASRSYALPRLQELLRAEQEAAQRPDAGQGAAANIEAVNVAIRKLQGLNTRSAGGGGGQQRRQSNRPQRPFREGNPRREGQGQGQGQPSRPNQGQQRHRGRRPQARRGGGGGGGGGGSGGGGRGPA
jgi:hypothetical protein